jgi:hypothetical protein
VIEILVIVAEEAVEEDGEDKIVVVVTVVEEAERRIHAIMTRILRKCLLMDGILHQRLPKKR